MCECTYLSYKLNKVYILFTISKWITCNSMWMGTLVLSSLASFYHLVRGFIQRDQHGQSIIIAGLGDLMIIAEFLGKLLLKASTGPKIRERNWKLFFLFLNQNICCGYSKEPSRWVSSFEHPKHMFKLMDKKIIAILRKLFFLKWPYASSYGSQGWRRKVCMWTRQRQRIWCLE